MDRKILQYQIEAHMDRYQHYTFDGMEVIYNEVMNNDYFILFEKWPQKTLHNALSEWGGVNGGWLIKQGEGKSAIFYKRVCHRRDISALQLLEGARKRIGALYKIVNPWS
jgi:hypothetical protein